MMGCNSWASPMHITSCCNSSTPGLMRTGNSAQATAQPSMIGTILFACEDPVSAKRLAPRGSRMRRRPPQLRAAAPTCPPHSQRRGCAVNWPACVSELPLGRIAPAAPPLKRPAPLPLSTKGHLLRICTWRQRVRQTAPLSVAHPSQTHPRPTQPGWSRPSPHLDQRRRAGTACQQGEVLQPLFPILSTFRVAQTVRLNPTTLLISHAPLRPLTAPQLQLVPDPAPSTHMGLCSEQAHLRLTLAPSTTGQTGVSIR
mmetsp:Transcript_2079/g.3309  ORF Transcript_2079/g.3309 Transcript_2079/m.3309 type:complete len:256 (+) Transcript_2079:397-1164(+)